MPGTAFSSLMLISSCILHKKYYKEKELSLISKIRKLAGREFRQHSLIMSETILRARLFFFKHRTFFSPHYLALYACFTRGPSRK